MLGDDGAVFRRDPVTAGEPVRDVVRRRVENRLTDQALDDAFSMSSKAAAIVLLVGISSYFGWRELGAARWDNFSQADPVVVLVLEALCVCMACWGLSGLIYGHSD